MLGKRDKMISKKLAYRLLKQNIIPSIRVGREYRIAKTDVVNFVTNK
jgi:excisionase family DNA binding protein